MRAWLAWLTVVAGCYDPSFQPGLPCADGQCPSGQQCDFGAPDGPRCVLEIVEIDAPIEDAPEVDGAADASPLVDARADERVDAPPVDAPPALVPIAVTPAPFTTTSTTFVDIPGGALTIPPSPGTSWLLVVSAELQSTTFVNVTVEARYLVDGVERGIGGSQNSVNGFPGPWEHFYVIDGGPVAKQVAFQLREANGSTAAIDNLNAIVIPLPASSHSFASSDALLPVTATTAAPVAALSLGALSGDYVFLMLVNASDLPGLQDIFVQWRGPSGEVWLTDSHQPREPWQSYFTMQRATVTSADAVVTLYGRVGGNTSNFRYARAVALRASAFPSLDFVRDDTLRQTTGTTPATTTTLNPSGTAAAYLHLSSMRTGENCATVPDAHRGVHLFVDGVEVSGYFHATDNCSYDATYGTARLLSATPSSITTSFSSGNGFVVETRGSAQLLLGLP